MNKEEEKTMSSTQKVLFLKSSWTQRFIFLSALSMFAFQVYLVCGRYFSYPRKVTVHIEADGVPFPTITLCKMRSLDFSVVDRLKTIYRENESMSEALEKHGASHEFIEKFLRFYHPLQIMYKAEKSYTGEDAFINAGNLKQLHRELVSSRTMSVNIDREIISEASAKLNQFIVSCQYERKDCTPQDFIESFQQQFFNCFTYKSPKINAQRRLGTYPAIKV